MQLVAKVTLIIKGKQRRNVYVSNMETKLFKVLVGFRGGHWSLCWNFQFNLIDLSMQFPTKSMKSANQQAAGYIYNQLSVPLSNSLALQSSNFFICCSPSLPKRPCLDLVCHLIFLILQILGFGSDTMHLVLNLLR